VTVDSAQMQELLDQNLAGYVGILEEALVTAASGRGALGTARGVFFAPFVPDLERNAYQIIADSNGIMMVDYATLLSDGFRQTILYRERDPLGSEPQVGYALLLDEGGIASGLTIEVQELIDLYVPKGADLFQRVDNQRALAIMMSNLTHLDLLI